MYEILRVGDKVYAGNVEERPDGVFIQGHVSRIHAGMMHVIGDRYNEQRQHIQSNLSYFLDDCTTTEELIDRSKIKERLALRPDEFAHLTGIMQQARIPSF